MVTLYYLDLTYLEVRTWPLVVFSLLLIKIHVSDYSMRSFKDGPGKQIVGIPVPASSFSVRESYFNSNVYFSLLQNEITIFPSQEVIVIIKLINVCQYLKVVPDA